MVKKTTGEEHEGVELTDYAKSRQGALKQSKRKGSLGNVRDTKSRRQNRLDQITGGGRPGKARKRS